MSNVGLIIIKLSFCYHVDRAPLVGRPHQFDTSKVNSYIITRFTSENNVAKQKILPYKDLNDNKKHYLALKEFYKEVRATLTAKADARYVLC